MVESPPLFLGYSAMRLAKKMGAKLIFNVSDLWPESAEKLGLVTNKYLLGMAYRLEAKCYKRAHLVTGQTMGIVEDITKRFPEVQAYWLPNGVDLTFYDRSKYVSGKYRDKHGFSQEQKLFFYGGVIGYAQGLDVILQAAVFFMNNPNVQFVLQGAGPEKDRLMELKNELSLNNVHFIAPVAKSEMPEVLMDVDAAIIPLRKLELFEGAIPSKIFETLAMEIPILLAVKGEARSHFVDKAKAALPIEPEDVQDLVTKIQHVLENPEEMCQMGKNGRTYALEHFDRNLIAAKFLERLNG
jgi:glycosyltransferase involved in cell wall biosynthesis